jgi:hypothetical protein
MALGDMANVDYWPYLIDYLNQASIKSLCVSDTIQETKLAEIQRMLQIRCF